MQKLAVDVEFFYGERVAGFQREAFAQRAKRRKPGFYESKRITDIDPRDFVSHVPRGVARIAGPRSSVGASAEQKRVQRRPGCSRETAASTMRKTCHPSRS